MMSPPVSASSLALSGGFAAARARSRSWSRSEVREPLGRADLNPGVRDGEQGLQVAEAHPGKQAPERRIARPLKRVLERGVLHEEPHECPRSCWGT